jgi:hypothetical protein
MKGAEVALAVSATVFGPLWACGRLRASNRKETHESICKRIGLSRIDRKPRFVAWRGAFIRRLGDDCYEWVMPTTCNDSGDNQVYTHLAFLAPSEKKPVPCANVVTQKVSAAREQFCKLFTKVARNGEGCFPDTNKDSTEAIPKHVGVLWRSDANGDFHRVGLFCRVGTEHILTTSHGVYREKDDSSLISELFADGAWAICSPAQDNAATAAGLSRPKRLFDVSFLGKESFGGGRCMTNRDFVLLRVSAGKKATCATSMVNAKSFSQAEIACLKPGHFTRATTGKHFCVTRNPDTGLWATREGEIQPHIEPFKSWGYVQHNMSTHPGASGGIIWSWLDGQFKVRGLHLGNLKCKETDDVVGYNLAIGAAILRRACGVVGLIDYGAFGKLEKAAETLSALFPNTVRRAGESAHKSSGDGDVEHEAYSEENSVEDIAVAFYDMYEREGKWGGKNRKQDLQDEDDACEGMFDDGWEGFAAYMKKTGGEFTVEESLAAVEAFNRMAEALDRKLSAFAPTEVGKASSSAPGLAIPARRVLVEDSIRVGTRGDPHPDPKTSRADEQYNLLAETRQRKELRTKAAKIVADAAMDKAKELVPNGQSLILPMFDEPGTIDLVTQTVECIARGGNNGFRPGLSVLSATSTTNGWLSAATFWEQFATTVGRRGPLEMYESGTTRLDFQYSDANIFGPDSRHPSLDFQVRLRHREDLVLDRAICELSDEQIVEQYHKFYEGEMGALEGLLGVDPERFYHLCCPELREYTHSMLRRVKHNDSYTESGWVHIGQFERPEGKPKPARTLDKDELDAVGALYGHKIRSDLEGYHIPTGVEAEMVASLRYDSGRRADVEAGLAENLMSVQNSFGAAFAELQARIGVPDYKLFETWDRLYVKAISEMDGTKSAGASGFPLKGSTVDKATALMAKPGLMHKLVSQRMALRYLVEYARTETHWSGYGPKEGALVQNCKHRGPDGKPTRNDIDGLCFALRDPELLFVKGEPHSKKKVAEGRFRCIYVSSLVDMLIQAILHKLFNNAVIAAYQASEVGTSFALGLGHHAAGLDKLRKTIVHLASFGPDGSSKRDGYEQWGDANFWGPPGVSEADATGWDNCVLGYMQAFAAELRCRSIDASARVHGCDDALLPALRVAKYLIRAQALLDGCHVAIAGQQLFVNTLAGVMASGHISTSVDNTSMRLFTTIAAYMFSEGYVPGDLIATGDDLLVGDGDEARFSGVCRALERFGVITKPGSMNTSMRRVEYTSHSFESRDSEVGLCCGFPMYTHEQVHRQAKNMVDVKYLNEAKTLRRFLAKVEVDSNGYRSVPSDVLRGVQAAMCNANPKAFEELVHRLRIHSS